MPTPQPDIAIKIEIQVREYDVDCNLRRDDTMSISGLSKIDDVVKALETTLQNINNPKVSK